MGEFIHAPHRLLTSEIFDTRFFSGCFIATFILPVYGMGDIHDVGRRSGTVMSIAALGALIGTPISGAISQYTGGFNAVGYYAGSWEVANDASTLR